MKPGDYILVSSTAHAFGGYVGFICGREVDFDEKFKFNVMLVKSKTGSQVHIPKTYFPQEILPYEAIELTVEDIEFMLDIALKERNEDDFKHYLSLLRNEVEKQ